MPNPYGKKPLSLKPKVRKRKLLLLGKKAVKASLHKAANFSGSPTGMGGALMRDPDIVADVLHTRTADIASAKNKFEALVDRSLVFATYRGLKIAEADLDQAIKLKPSSLEALFYRGIVRSQSKNFIEATEDLDKVVNRFTEKPAGQNFSLGDALLFCGLSKLMLPEKRQEAYEDLTKAIEVSLWKQTLFKKVVA